MFSQRIDRAREAMADRGVDVLLLSVGADLPYFCGYEAMPLERLTMLVVPRDGDVHLVVPHLEAPRVVERPEVFDLVTWRDGEDPIARVVDLVGGAATAAVGDQMWAGFLVDLGTACPTLSFTRASEVTAPLRMVKDADEVEALRRAGAAVDRILADVQAGQVPLVGRTEADVAAQIGRRILDEGHHRINFVIVASGPNAASPHRAGGPGHRGRRGGAVRHRRHHGRPGRCRLLLRHHPVRPHWPASRWVRRALRGAARLTDRRGGRSHRWYPM